jgi:hypothetical protein
MQAHGWMVDTGRTKKPRRSQESLDRAERFQGGGPVSLEGGKDAQPTFRSFWWRIFRVPALTEVVSALTPAGRTRRLMTFRNA